jgi:hypothetical protein
MIGCTRGTVIPLDMCATADFVTRRAVPLSPITGAIDRIHDSDILAQLAGAAPIGHDGGIDLPRVGDGQL